MRRHRDLPPIPSDPTARRDAIRALEAHAIWRHPNLDMTPEKAAAHARMLVAGMDMDVQRMADVLMSSGGFEDGLHIWWGFHDPTIRAHAEDDTRNLHFGVGLESGPWLDVAGEPDAVEPAGGWTDENRWVTLHDHRLDCGADTLEQAFLELARLVPLYYGADGNDRVDAPVRCAAGCVDVDTDGFCTGCGFLADED